jgi:molecular chaperone GrpE
VTERDRERGEDRPRVRVTDRRRVRGPDEGEESPPRSETPASEAAPPDEGETDVDKARRQAAEYRDHLQRMAAEFDNYRKRTVKEQTNALERAAEPFIRRLLEVLDEFDLALMAAGRSPELEQFLHGVELVYAKLADVLRAEGLERIDAEGAPFDPELHEALMQSGDGDGDPIVAEVFRPGYTLRGRVIRPAGVRVARK